MEPGWKVVRVAGWSFGLGFSKVLFLTASGRYLQGADLREAENARIVRVFRLQW